jgi:tripartite-type tricarboxylate transporter receptor subunit TctC
MTTIRSHLLVAPLHEVLWFARKRRTAHGYHNVTRKLCALVFIVVAFGISASSAEDYPSRPVTIVVPYPPGGPTYTLARIIADRVNAPLGQPLVIENISGAGGSIGVGRVAHSTSDGYTLSIGNVQTHVLNGATMKLDYDVVNDFAPISLIADTPIWIISRKSLPAGDLTGLIAWLKARDGKATAGTVGVGGPTEIVGLIFQKQTGVTFQTVPYRGGAPLLQDLLGEHIDFAFGQAATYLSYVRNGELKAYAVVGSKRWSAAPEVPTLDELGIYNVYGSFWHAIWAPRGTPDNVISKLNAAIRQTLADPTIRERFRTVGQDIWPAEEQTPEALAAKQKAEIGRWSLIIKEAGIKAD